MGQTPSQALEIMRRQGVKHVPVVDQEQKVLGMISFRDLIREVIRQGVN